MKKNIILSITMFTMALLFAPVSANAADEVKSVNHRGYNTVAPENTLPAYQLSHEMGFTYVEADISFTKDNVPVLLHDSTINRTARNTDGSAIATSTPISNINYADALQYDYGIWKSQSYSGTQIPTFREFLALCNQYHLHPYIELKNNGDYTSTQIEELVDMVDQYHLTGKVTWISFSDQYLAWVRNKDPQARLGYIAYQINGNERAIIEKAKNLRSGSNTVFLDLMIGAFGSDMISLSRENNIAIEVWTINRPEEINTLDSYISGITTNKPKYEDRPAITSNTSDSGKNAAQNNNAGKNNNDNSGTISNSGSAATTQSADFHSGLKVTQTKGKLKISWDNTNGISKYEVYAAYINDKFSSKPVKTTSRNSAVIKKIKGKKIDTAGCYKLYVQAYDQNGNIAGKSVVSYVAGSANKKYSNPKSIKVASKSVILSAGEADKIKATVKYKKAESKPIPTSKVSKLRFESTDPAIAVVSKNGTITAKGEGTCYVYVFAANGLAKKIPVTVSK